LDDTFAYYDVSDIEHLDNINQALQSRAKDIIQESSLTATDVLIPLRKYPLIKFKSVSKGDSKGTKTTHICSVCIGNGRNRPAAMMIIFKMKPYDELSFEEINDDTPTPTVRFNL
jgi:hypothetical protein